VTEEPFRLSTEVMRSMGYRVIDQLVGMVEHVDDGPVVIPATAAELRARIDSDPSASPVDFDDLMAAVAAEVVPHSTLWGHPRNFAYVPGSATWIGALADLIASTLNLEASVWRESPAPVHLELTVLEWFRQWVGFPEGSSGLLLGGGSAANLTALAAARQVVVGTGHPEATVYCSSEVHTSITRAARVLGFGDDRIRAVPVDRWGAMLAGDLGAGVDADLAAGGRPAIVVASAGTTSTGAVDPIADIAAIARRHGMWLHIDAAYGGFAVLTGRGKDRLGPLGLADSITLDPHKWLFQPYEVGALLVRRPELLEDAFRMRPAYLQDTTDRPEEINLADRGLQQTRAFRALKVWMSVMGYGLDAFRAAIDTCLDLALHVEQRVAASDRFELLTPAQLSIVCFRRTAPTEVEAEALNAALVEGLLASGEGFVSSTRVDGRYALRICLVNHSTTREDVDRVLDWLESADPIG
jgi:aromatic-L-amino-acid/L-tryptophan decarboxylase